MAHAYHHALSSVKKWGGVPGDYVHLHAWFDESKQILADYRHRALRHHAEGIFMLEKLFGTTVTLSTGRVIPTRWVGEQHVREDLGRIPSWADWCREIRPQPWMGRATTLGVEDDPRGTRQHGPLRDIRNDDRVERARAAMSAYAMAKEIPVAESADAIADVIADLLHLASHNGIGPAGTEELLRLAQLHHRAEQDDPDEAPLQSAA